MVTTKDIIFLINPHSGKRKIDGIIKQIENYEDKLSYFISSSYDKFIQFLDKNINKYKVFVIVGGDGTINSSINYFYNYTDKILAVIPTGSGNGFAREFGFENNINKLIHDILNNNIIEVDVLEVNKKKFINLFGVGFDSYVAHVFDKRKGRGLWNYIISVIISIFKFKPVEAEIIFGKEKIFEKFNMVIVANISQFGNNAIIAPKAIPTNGFYELVLIKPFPFYVYPSFILKMMTGKLKESKYIKYIKSKERLIIKTSTTKCHIDGEPISLNEDIVINVLENKIKFVKT